MESKIDKKSLYIKIINIVIWVILYILMMFCIIDFSRTRQEKKPLFCIKKETKNYTDGSVDSCLGLGYKIYHYNRKSFKAIEFGPFWTKDRSNKESN